MATQHDKIFKQLLRVFLADFLRLAAPQALERLDLSSPQLLDKELFAGGPHGRRRELDLLARVRTLDGPSASQAVAPRSIWSAPSLWPGLSRPSWTPARGAAPS